MIVVSYYTDNAYKAKAVRLAAGLDLLGLPRDIVEMPDQGSWMKNTYMKAPFILERVKKHGCPVLWVDADAVVERSPELLLSPAFEFAVYRYSPVKLFRGAAWHNSGQAWNGTTYCANTPEAMRILDAWIQMNKAYPDRLEQKNLATALAAADASRIACLPPEYCWVERVMRKHMRAAQPVIVHEAERLTATGKRSERGTDESDAAQP